MKEQTFNEWLDTLKSKANIVDVVAGYVPLTSKGGRYWACCPFHHEKTPSFSVDEQRQAYYCFGCHVGGDVIKFVMDIENIDFMSACKLLSQKVGLPMPEFKSKRPGENTHKKKERLYDLMKTAARFYYDCLVSDGGKIARDYLEKRGISKSTAVTFGLGYSPDYNKLPAFLKEKGFNELEMIEAGACAQKEGKVYDVMAGRLIVPIIDGMKRVIAFGGRVLTSEKQMKYRNTNDTLIFNKKCEVFGQDTLKKYKLKNAVNSVIMVEGYMDVISLYQAGVQNVVASMGTALNVKQAEIVKRYSDTVYVCYDGDTAGQAATLRSLDIFYGAGLNVKVVSLPDNLDPDEYVKERGVENFSAQLAKALPLFEYKLRTLAKGYDMKVAEEQGKFVVEAVKILKTLPSPAQIDAYIPIVSKLSGLGNDTVRRQLMQESEFSEEGAPTLLTEKPKRKDGKYYKAMRFVLYALFGGVEDLRFDKDLSLYCEDDEHKKLYDYYRQNSDSELSVDDLISLEKQYPEAAEVMATGRIVNEKVAKTYFFDCVRALENEFVKKQRKSLLKAYTESGSEDEKTQILAQMSNNQKKK